MDRQTLLSAVRRAQGAAGSKSAAPAFDAVFFDGRTATSYDGELAIITPCKLNLDGGVECKLLATWLAGCSGDEIKIEPERNEVTFKCGRSKLTVSLLPRKQLTFSPYSGTGIELREGLAPVAAAVKRAAPFVGSDEAVPSRTGITAAGKDNALYIYATDNITITSQRIKGFNDLNFQANLPPRFIKALLSLHNDSELVAVEFGDGWASASFQSDPVDETILFTRTGSELDADEYNKIIQEVWDEVLDQSEITDEVVNAIKRVVSVVAAVGDNECQLVIKNGTLAINSGQHSRAKAGETVEIDAEHSATIWVPAKELLRTLDGATRFAIVDGVAVVAWHGSSVMNLIAASVSE